MIRDHLSHGGNTRLIAASSGLPESRILDFSANINPFGPPPWLAEAMKEGLSRITFYPDPEATEARNAASLKFSSPAERFLFANGADSLLFALPGALKADACVLPVPTYSGYRRAIRHAGIQEIDLPLLSEEGFRMDSPRFVASLREALEGRWRPETAASQQGDAKAKRMIVFLGAPNNPAGGILPASLIEDLACELPRHTFVIDESFLELSLGGQSLIGTEIANIVVARSLTKAWAVPGARVGFIYASPEICAAVRADIPAWPVSSFAEAIATRALGDTDFLRRTVPALMATEAVFSMALGELRGFKVYRSGANFLLLDAGDDARGALIAESLLGMGIAVRRFSPAEGLSERYTRLAVRSQGENRRFIEALKTILDSERAR